VSGSRGCSNSGSNGCSGGGSSGSAGSGCTGCCCSGSRSDSVVVFDCVSDGSGCVVSDSGSGGSSSSGS
jgi:hypothetical protein